MDEMQVPPGSCVAEGRTDTLTEDEFRALRDTGLGGSDSGAIMGLSPYETAMTVVASKIGLIKGFEGNRATKRGKRLEPAIRQFFAQWYFEEFGVEIKVFASPWFYRSVKYPWMTANIDGLILHPEYGLCNFEIKTGNERQEEHWDNDSIPDTYYAQGQHYSVVTGLPMTIYGGLVGLDLVIRHAPANEEFQMRMIEAESVIFHDFIQKGVLPAPVGHEKEDEVLSAMYNQPTKEAIDLSAMKDIAARHVELSAAMKEMEAEKKRLAAELKLAIGNANVGMMPGYKATWSRFEVARFDKDQFSKDYPDLVAQYTTKEPSGRFTVTALK